jgi:hypothetical protein
MPQQTIYLDSETEKRARQAARSAGVPVSRWIAAVIKDRTQTEWPPDVALLAGAWSDFPSLSALRRRNLAKDVRREKL